MIVGSRPAPFPEPDFNDDLVLDADQFMAWIAQSRVTPPDIDHALRCAGFARDLVRALAPDLDLNEADVRIVTVAALFHDVGYLRSLHDHHRKTWDTVRRFRLDGISFTQLRLAAIAARFHGTDSPTIEHSGFEDLDFDDQRRSRRQVALVKIAVALDASHLGIVERVTVTQRASNAPHLIAHASAESGVDRDRLRDAVHHYTRLTHRPLTAEFRPASVTPVRASQPTDESDTPPPTRAENGEA